MRWAIRDRATFKQTMTKLLDRVFDRIVVAHGSIIENNGKARLREALHRAELV
jgi:type I restriction-modification system DNA methylase subunit